MDSDAVFHEESEYVISFKSWWTSDELSSSFRKNAFHFLQKMQKRSKKYLTCIFFKIGSSWEHSITKMISAKVSTNPENFSRFVRGRRIDWRNPMDLPISFCHKREQLFRVSHFNPVGLH
jgi:hypothetical protein